MNKRLIVHTTDGFSREDGSVYYSAYYLVESPTLSFSEAIFQTEIDDEMSQTEIFELLEKIGYTVTELDATILLDTQE